MNADRFSAITGQYPRLRVGVVGDFCLDRYLEIDPTRTETSIETGLPVYNVVRVRAQPGGAGTIVNNLVALGIGQIYPIGFCGEDGEGYELRRALSALWGVALDRFITTPLRRTFVYGKPLVIEPVGPPRELNRLDAKNWTSTPGELQDDLAARVRDLAPLVDAMIVLDQVDSPETGAATRRVVAAVHSVLRERPNLVVLADCRRGLADYPPLGFKMNAAELGRLSGAEAADRHIVERLTAELATRNAQPVFVTLAEQGIVAALPKHLAKHVAAHPVRGPIDIVGAGDAVTANLASALAAGAGLIEAMELAMTAASIVIHQLGTTGAATVAQSAGLLFGADPTH
ncbi:MAG TPA: PfkB family carbohydrate kinase [Pirellulales bacterium]|jgi:rfaE bifunctional protein kinase chain/domain|nr:PfkB family carbohydrate kinase [Pirellulales bacterium]